MIWRRLVRAATESFKAWRRGERRIAPASVRGRVYERRDPTAGGLNTKTKLKATMRLRVWRAAKGAWEEVK